MLLQQPSRHVTIDAMKDVAISNADMPDPELLTSQQVNYISYRYSVSLRLQKCSRGCHCIKVRKFPPKRQQSLLLADFSCEYMHNVVHRISYTVYVHASLKVA